MVDGEHEQRAIGKAYLVEEKGIFVRGVEWFCFEIIFWFHHL
jgi:hypothetical protein